MQPFFLVVEIWQNRFIFVNIVGNMFGMIVEIFDKKFYGCIES